MDIGLSISFAFKDEDWLKKLGVGALYTLACIFIIPIPILVGYQLATLRNTLNGDKHPLPTWDNAGELFSDGLKLFVAGLIYALPMLILYGLGFGFVFAVAESNSGDLFGLAFSLIQCIGMAYGLALAILAPAIALQYIQFGTIGECFNFEAIFGFTRRNIGNVLLAWLTVLVASLMMQIAAAVASITICGGIIVALAGVPWLMAVRGHLYAQIALNDDQWGKNDKEAYYDDFAY